MALVSILKFYFFGLPTGLSYQARGFVFATSGTIFSGLIFGSLFYLLFRLFWRKWDNKVFMILITVMWLIVLLTQK